MIRITRWDMDQRGHELRAERRRRGQASFHDLTGANVPNGTGTLVPVGHTRDFDYPENGVFYAEGSIRLHGVIGMTGNVTNDVRTSRSS